MSKSKLFVALAAAFIVGIFIGDFFFIEKSWLLGVGLGTLLALILEQKSSNWRLGLLIFLGLVSGYAYFNFWDSRQKDIDLVYGKDQIIEGQVVTYPDFSGNIAQYTIRSNGAKILLNTGRYPELRYGDVVRVQGKINQPSKYLFYKNFSGQIKTDKIPEKLGNKGNFLFKAIFLIKDKFESSLNKSLAEPYASFAAGLVLGSKRNIPDSLMSDLNRTGTTHIIAVSGYNVTIIIIYIGIFLGLISRQVKFWGSIAAIIAFIIITGASASVVRAGILASLVVFAHFIGRRVNMTILIFLVASLMLLFNPYALKYDISYELSFLSFIGIIYLGPVILKFTEFLPQILAKGLSETLAAQILVLPILIYYFGQLSLTAPITNILILPFIPLAMAFVFLIGLGGIVFVFLGHYLAMIGYFVLRYIILIIEGFSKVPFSSWRIESNSWWWLPLCYLAIILIILKFKTENAQENFFSTDS